MLQTFSQSTCQDTYTLAMQRLLVKDKLTALTSLWLHNACEVLDDKAPLQSLLGLQVTFDTLNKAYHGEWWAHLKRLYTKSPCNVPLGVAGHLPEGLEFLCLHTCCPEPLTVSTGAMTTQPKAYPHQVGFRMPVIHAFFLFLEKKELKCRRIQSRLAVITG